MNKGSRKNPEKEAGALDERAEFKIELKKIGTLEENTQQDGPYDIICCGITDN